MIASDPNLLVGTETFDDAGVYRLRDDLALVQTVDFFPPLVDDPYEFGRIAAANALSDVYAMNGQPVTVLNLVAFPENELPLEVLGAILRGAAERVAAAGAVTVGGHSVRGAELIFGLSVTGTVHPAELIANTGARVGDRLILTKPLGTGFIATAAKKEQCPTETLAAAIASMTQLNAIGRDAARASGGAQGLTDVTGFGLLGHAAELADGSGVTIEIDSRALPAIEGARALATTAFYTKASKSNRAYVADRSSIFPDADPIGVELAFDAQTSGGLLISVDPSRVDRLLAELSARGAAAAAVIGRVLAREGTRSVVLK